MESYITYEIKTTTTQITYPSTNFNVRRRYTDFEFLKQKLETEFASSIIPPLPQKHVVRGVLERFEVILWVRREKIYFNFFQQNNWVLFFKTKFTGKKVQDQYIQFFFQTSSFLFY
jgi:sorting nexin-7/30